LDLLSPNALILSQIITLKFVNKPRLTQFILVMVSYLKMLTLSRDLRKLVITLLDLLLQLSDLWALRVKLNRSWKPLVFLFYLVSMELKATLKFYYQSPNASVSPFYLKPVLEEVVKECVSFKLKLTSLRH